MDELWSLLRNSAFGERVGDAGVNALIDLATTNPRISDLLAARVRGDDIHETLVSLGGEVHGHYGRMAMYAGRGQHIPGQSGGAACTDECGTLYFFRGL